MKIKYFYECGGCDQYHPLGWTGDCRDDKNRYSYDDEGNLVNSFGEGFRAFTFEIVDEDFDDQVKDFLLEHNLSTCGVPNCELCYSIYEKNKGA